MSKISKEKKGSKCQSDENLIVDEEACNSYRVLLLLFALLYFCFREVKNICSINNKKEFDIV